MHPQLTLNLGLRYELDTDVNNISRVDELNPIVVPFRHLPRHRDTNNWAPRIGFNWSTRGRPDERPRRLRHLLRPRDAADPVARAGPRRPGAADRGAGRQRVLHGSGDGPGTAVCADRVQPVHRLHPARGRRVRHQHHRLAAAEPEGAAGCRSGSSDSSGRGRCCAWTVVHNHGTDFIIGRTVGTVFNPVVGGPDRVVNLESSAENRLRRPAGGVRAALHGALRRSAPPTRCRRPTTMPTTIRFRSAAGRSIRTISRASTGRRRTTSGIGSRCPGVVDVGRRRSGSPGCGRWPRACRWTS